MIWWTCLTK